MNQENGTWHTPIKKRSVYGMPVKFQAYIKDENRVVKIITDIDRECIVTERTEERRFGYDLKEVILLQTIGATDTSDPPQELYFGDLIEFNLDKKDVVGEIVWLNFSVWVRLWRNENTLSYLSLSHVLDYFKIKKLGSRYDPKMKQVLKKTESG